MLVFMLEMPQYDQIPQSPQKCHSQPLDVSILSEVPGSHSYQEVEGMMSSDKIAGRTGPGPVQEQLVEHDESITGEGLKPAQQVFLQEPILCFFACAEHKICGRAGRVQ